MRTNINIADDARQFAEIYAHANGITLGDAVTELIRNQAAAAAQSKPPKFGRSRSGFPILPRRNRILTTEMVLKAQHEEDVV